MANRRDLAPIGARSRRGLGRYGEFRTDGLELCLEYPDTLAKPVVIELHQGAGCQFGEICQHGAFIVAEIGAGDMRSIERQSNAAEAIPDRHREDRPP